MPQILDTIQLIISCGTLVGMAYAFYKFASKPENTQNERITALEAWQKQLENQMAIDKASLERRLGMGSEHFSTIDEGTKITQSAILAIMDTLLNEGDNKDELKRRRDDLYEYLTGRPHTK